MNNVKTKTLKINKIRIWGKDYPFAITYKYAKAPILTTENGVIKVILPMKYKKIDKNIVMKVLLEKLYESIAEKEIENMMEKIRIKLKFAPEDYLIKRMDGCLGKCLTNTIVINPDIIKYRKNIVEYIILHEFCHLKYKNHSKKFYAFLKQYIPNYENIAYEICGLEY